jgi:thiamine pyrophosphate-dependent acetolactate synthase large subunit-like protein
MADEAHIPVVLEPFWNDRLGIAPGHRCYLGPLTEGSSLGRTADFVLAIGCRMFNEVHPRSTSWFAPVAFVAHVNADPAKLEQTFGVSWSAAVDPGIFAGSLLTAYRERPTPDDTLAARRIRLDAARARRSQLRPGPFSGAATALADELDRAFLVDESVSANLPIVSALTSARGERYVSTTGGSLGWGVGAACGVAIATGEPVTCVLGDGAFFFGLQGLWPAVAQSLPVTFVVLDNGGFASTQYFEDRYVETLPDPQCRQASYVGSDFGKCGPSVSETGRGFGLTVVEVLDGDQLACELTRERVAAPRLLRLPIDGSD